MTTAQRLVSLFAADRVRLLSLGRQAGSALRVYDALRERPVATAALLAERTGLAFPTVNGALEQLQRLSIVHEITGRKRDRMFSYAAYIQILSEGTEPL